MRTTLNIDDNLYTEAVKLTGMQEKTASAIYPFLRTFTAMNNPIF